MNELGFLIWSLIDYYDILVSCLITIDGINTTLKFELYAGK